MQQHSSESNEEYLFTPRENVGAYVIYAQGVTPVNQGINALSLVLEESASGYPSGAIRSLNQEGLKVVHWKGTSLIDLLSGFDLIKPIDEAIEQGEVECNEVQEVVKYRDADGPEQFIWNLMKVRDDEANEDERSVLNGLIFKIKAKYGKV